jgi:outer membrane protein OmpA-like peptidoglycan-associated protein
MPCIIIGIDKWMRSNRPIVEGLLQAALEGGDQVKARPDALRRAAEISAAVYNEQGADAAYWEKYYKGTIEKDVQGLDVELGGSSVNNLADALLTFGLVPGSANLFAATYETFGDIVVNQYRELVPNYPPVRDILDTSYLQAVARRIGGGGGAARTAVATATKAAAPRFEAKRPVRSVVSRRAWNIPFNSGQATFTPEGARQLQRLRRDLLVASGAVVEIHGHTDSQGDPAKNLQLSEDRAFAVQRWLEKQFPVNFPKGRVRVFSHGQQNPVASNSTPQGRAQNRRVEIVIGTS